MLSSQELQEELALWGNAQFQLEPINEDQKDIIKRTSTSSTATTMVSPSIPTDAWGLMSLGQSQQSTSGVHLASQSTTAQTADPLEFMVGSGTSAADFLSAITSQDSSSSQHSYHSQQQQQGQQSTIIINGVPMLPLMSLPRQQQQQQESTAANRLAEVTRRQSKHAAIAPAPSRQFHQPTILPKGSAVPSSIFGHVPPKDKSAPPPTSATQSTSSYEGSAARRDESVEGAEAEQDLDDNDERQRTAVADKRRRNTAASARFRVKKKMREQALEQNAREMTAKAEALEKRVQELEIETRWLKSLITEKDPNALDKIHCPCHHPNGFDLADSEAAATAQSLVRGLCV
ncbi:hypothetical protein EV178_001514 [Coemansia sp. RSA 1646]|nr:hypothetical protein EV178_001514 [Coemansia sp. RSA 1646]